MYAMNVPSSGGTFGLGSAWAEHANGKRASHISKPISQSLLSDYAVAELLRLGALVLDTAEFHVLYSH